MCVEVKPLKTANVQGVDFLEKKQQITYAYKNSII